MIHENYYDLLGGHDGLKSHTQILTKKVGTYVQDLFSHREYILQERYTCLQADSLIWSHGFEIGFCVENKIIFYFSLFFRK